jgi:hypothetical protein
MSGEQRAQVVLDMLGARERTTSELYDEIPVQPCAGWAEHGMGAFDVRTGERGVKEWNYQSLYQALERLRLTGRVERRLERGRGERSSDRTVWVYFATPAPLDGRIADLDRAVRS